MAENAILFDGSKCCACKGCQIMCKQWNELPSNMGMNVYEFTGYQAPMDLSGDTRLIITFDETEGGPNGVEWAFGRRSCYHCADPACEKVCPVGAITKLENGTVHLNVDKCIGCKYCNAACPFEVPKYKERTNYSDKCTLCADRVNQGRTPSCVSTCPGGALEFGERDEMLKLGHERIDYLKNKGFDKAELYGENEMGGLHVLQVAKYGLEQHQLPRDPQTSFFVEAIKYAKPVTAAAVGAVAVGLGASYLAARGYKRDEQTLEEYQAHKDAPESTSVDDDTTKEA